MIERHAAPLLLAFCLVLGGASAAGVMANAAIQLAALAVATALLVRRVPITGAARWPLLLLGATAAVLLVQVLKLPPAIWHRLPGHGEVARTFALAGMGNPWLPVSLLPDRTLAMLLSLVVPLGMFVATLAAPLRNRRRAAAAIVLLALLSVGIGLIQRAGGEGSPFYIYEVTNRGSAVGLFANRNHLGTLLLCALPFAAAGWRGIDGPVGRKRAALVLAATAMLSAGAVMTGSDAAVLLLGPALLASVAVAAPRAARRWWLAALALLLVAVAAVGAAGLLLAHPDATPNPQRRGVIVPATLRAAADYLPLGAGGGTFAAVYAAREDRSAVTPEFVNHAHSDWAELLLELGLPGAALAAAFAAWWIGRARVAWRGEPDDALARAGVAALGVVMAASAVDYPARTAAIAAIAGFAAALTIAPATAGLLPPNPAGKRHRHARPSLLVGADDI